MTRFVRWTIGIGALLTLVAVYLFQRLNFTDYLARLLEHNWLTNASVEFVMNRTLRMVVNDLACVALIKVIFMENRHTRLAFLVFLVELVIILPTYFVVKLYLEGPTEISSPALAQVHRIIVNPLLMVLLMFGLVYQRVQESKSKSN